MAKESERARAMKAGFMELHNEGLTIPEIAEKFGMDSSTIYKKHLQDIADANGVSRESLLQVVKAPSERKLLREEAKKVQVDVEKMKVQFHNAEESIKTLIDMIHETLKEENVNG